MASDPIKREWRKCPTCGGGGGLYEPPIEPISIEEVHRRKLRVPGGMDAADWVAQMRGQGDDAELHTRIAALEAKLKACEEELDQFRHSIDWINAEEREARGMSRTKAEASTVCVCGQCGCLMTAVRPGKHQCDNCDELRILRESLEQHDPDMHTKLYVEQKGAGDDSGS